MVTDLDKCQNLACPNRAHEGKFSALIIEGGPGTSFRPIALFLCKPCGLALHPLLEAVS